MTPKAEKTIINQKHLEDYLTSLYNKNYFIKNMHGISSKMIEELNENKVWSLLFCDINGLKLTNDTIGHLEADKGISHLASIIKSSIRTQRRTKDKIVYPNKDGKYDKNISIRFGGDEFLIILPNCNKESATLISNRIKQKIDKNKEQARNMTLSIGIADTSEINKPLVLKDKPSITLFIEDLINLAEKRMHLDKNETQNILSYEEKKLFVMKHLGRAFNQIGLNLEGPEQIDIIIDLLTELKNTKQEKDESN